MLVVIGLWALFFCLLTARIGLGLRHRPFYPHSMRIVVLGAGFGGLELTTLLSEEFGDGLDLTLIDKGEGFVFGFSKLDVMFDRDPAGRVLHRYADIVKPGVRFVQAVISEIDPAAKRVVTDAGTFEADILVVALGADLHPEATPGLIEGGHEFYTVAGAFGLRDILASLTSGRIVIGVTSTPFKCPPAPSETALLLHDLLTNRGVRDDCSITLVMPFGVPIPPSPDASRVLLDTFKERGITFVGENLVRALDPARKVAVLGDGAELEYDLFLGVPVHRVPEVVAASGMTADGWIPVDPLTLETSFPDVYALGDVTSVGTPKAGVFAEGQATVVAGAIAARLRPGTPASTYDGRGVCYLEFGGDTVCKVEVNFVAGERPRGAMEGPSLELARDKSDFGTTRVRRWFGREWAPVSV